MNSAAGGHATLRHRSPCESRPSVAVRVAAIGRHANLGHRSPCESRPSAVVRSGRMEPMARETPTPIASHPEIYPERTLWLLAIAHAVNHAQAVLLPLVYLQILSEFHVTLADVAA